MDEEKGFESSEIHTESHLKSVSSCGLSSETIGSASQEEAKEENRRRWLSNGATACGRSPTIIAYIWFMHQHKRINAESV